MRRFRCQGDEVNDGKREEKEMISEGDERARRTEYQ